MEWYGEVLGNLAPYKLEKGERKGKERKGKWGQAGRASWGIFFSFSLSDGEVHEEDGILVLRSHNNLKGENQKGKNEVEERIGEMVVFEY